MMNLYGMLEGDGQTIETYEPLFKQETVSIMEFRDGKVTRETQYFADPFGPPAWRAQWVERME